MTTPIGIKIVSSTIISCQKHRTLSGIHIKLKFQKLWSTRVRKTKHIIAIESSAEILLSKP